MRQKKLTIFLIVIFACGGIVGWLSDRWYLLHGNINAGQQDLFSKVRPLRLQNNQYKYIGPLLGYELPESTQFREYEPLEKKIQDSISQSYKNGDANTIALYFRDHDTGRWVGVNEDTTFAPASLLKIPVMIGYYKLAETDPSVLNKQVVFSDTDDLNRMEVIKPSQNLEQNKSYTIDELIRRMIVYSDNNATKLLIANINNNSLDEIFSDFNIQLPKDGQPINFISDKTYSLFFRTLFNATYLSAAMSEKALALLATSDFKDGLVAGVPGTMAVAHKFGEYAEVNDAGVRTLQELHDCGDVYFPDHPYLLCVMTKGQDIDKLKTVIANLSKLVYEEMKAQYHSQP